MIVVGLAFIILVNTGRVEEGIQEGRTATGLVASIHAGLHHADSTRFDVTNGPTLWSVLSAIFYALRTMRTRVS